MKKGVILYGLFLFLIVLIIGSSFFVSALTETEKRENIILAYNCLSDEISQKGCSGLSFDEKIVASMILDDCRGDISLIEGHLSNNDLKQTAQAYFAEEGCSDVSKVGDWILSRRATTKDLEWFLEIDSPEEVSCTISYRDNPYSIQIGEDKKVSASAGECLIPANAA